MILFPSRPHYKQQGMSLIEILVSLGLGAFMLLGIISLMASVSNTRLGLANTSDQIENGRYALQLLNEDISLAGFYGRYHPGVGVANYSLPNPCSDASIIANLGFDASSPVSLPAPIVGYPSGATLPSCLTSEARANSEVLVVHRVDTSSVAVSSISSTTVPYLQIADCDIGAQFVFSKIAGDLNLKLKDCSTSAEAWPYVVRSYFISPCEDCTDPGDGKPTLKMREFRNGVLTTHSLVSGVEDMHIRYGLDLDGDGGPDCYEANPTQDTAPASCAVAGWSASDAENWQNVVTVQINLLVRSMGKTASTMAKSYDLGRESPSSPAVDGYKRQVYSTLINVPNIAGARE
jgi:type IV pilus assembly protein PilW